MSNRLGIYGDSFGKLNLHDTSLGLSWIDELATISNITTINNYASPGSSLMKCYESYKNTKHLNDINVFIIPSLDRVYSSYLREHFKKYTINENWYASVQSSKLTKETFNKRYQGALEFENKIFDSLISYHEYWKPVDTDVLLHKTFALDLIERSNNTIFLYTDNRLFEDEFTLLDLHQWELNMLGWHDIFTVNGIHFHTVKDGKYLADARKNHLSEENNIILAHKIKETIDMKENVVKINPKDFVVPRMPLEFYVTWRSI